MYACYMSQQDSFESDDATKRGLNEDVKSKNFMALGGAKRRPEP